MVIRAYTSIPAQKMQKNKKNVPNMNSNMDLIPFAFIMKRGHDTKNLNLKNLRQGFYYPFLWCAFYRSPEMIIWKVIAHVLYLFYGVTSKPCNIKYMQSIPIIQSSKFLNESRQWSYLWLWTLEKRTLRNETAIHSKIN